MKKTYITRMITVAMAITMALSALTGCGRNAATAPMSEAKYDASTAAEACAPAENYVEYEEEYDPGYYDEGYEYEAAAEDYDTYLNSGYEGAAAETTGEEYATYDGSYDMAAKSYASRETGKSESYLGGIYDSYNGYDYDDEKYSNEEYSELDEQGYKSVKNHPLSTFAADVDTASYSNLRRMLSEGYSLRNLPEGSVRIEEMLNYFDYDYEGPRGKEPFGVNTEISTCPWNPAALLMSIGLKTEDIDFENTPDSNLVFLIDVSGSMAADDKLPLLQEAFCMLVDELSDKDRVSIVTYTNGVETVLAGEKGSNTRTIKRAINHLFAGGGTNGSDGIQTAYRLAEKNFIKGGNNRIILATDGDLNIGLTSVEELEDLISKKKESGVYLSVLGFGTGNLKDNKMETLADKGNGNYSYIDSVREAEKVMVKELSANMLTVCKDVKFQVEFNPEFVKGYRLVGYANRAMKDRDFNNDRKDGGEIGAGHEVTVLYEIIPNDEDTVLTLGCVGAGDLKYADQFRSRYDHKGNDELLTLSIRYKRPAEDKSSLLSYPVTFNDYTYSPSDDFIFQSAVAEFGLVASDSLFSADADLDDAIDMLESIRLNDEYKQEFYEMISNL
ncbi:MAG: VWA domain-containing protein [Lachnospiraceae bacterium]|nr:VWA domain-containing protein [Lachnospiraceae bacterium]